MGYGLRDVGPCHLSLRKCALFLQQQVSTRLRCVDVVLVPLSLPYRFRLVRLTIVSDCRLAASSTGVRSEEVRASTLYDMMLRHGHFNYDQCPCK